MCCACSAFQRPPCACTHVLAPHRTHCARLSTLLGAVVLYGYSEANHRATVQWRGERNREQLQRQPPSAGSCRAVSLAVPRHGRRRCRRPARETLGPSGRIVEVYLVPARIQQSPQDPSRQLCRFDVHHRLARHPGPIARHPRPRSLLGNSQPTFPSRIPQPLRGQLGLHP